MHRRKRKPSEIRRAEVLGKIYQDAAYIPKFAIGIMCPDESDQMAVYKRLKSMFEQHELKVLVI